MKLFGASTWDRIKDASGNPLAPTPYDPTTGCGEVTILKAQRQNNLNFEFKVEVDKTAGNTLSGVQKATFFDGYSVTFAGAAGGGGDPGCTPETHPNIWPNC